MNAPDYIAKGDVRRRAGEQIPAFLPTLALHDLLRLQFDQDLHQVIRRNALLSRKIFDSHRFAGRVMPRQTKHSPRRIIAFDREFHRANLLNRPL